MSVPIRVLVVEDSESDMLLLERVLRQGGYEPISRRVETAEAMSDALQNEEWDVVISDYMLPRFSGLEALQVFNNDAHDLPFILVSGKIGEEAAVEAMKAGAHDYVMKDNLVRLAPAIQRELREALLRAERLVAEEALHESQKRYRRLVETMNDGMGVDDENGVFTYVNDRLCAIWGYERDDLIGHAVTDFLDTESQQILLEQTERRRKGQRGSYELALTHRDGRIVHCIISSAPLFGPHDDYKGSFGVFTDITDRKRAEEALGESEEKWRSMAENSPDYIMLIDPGGTLQFINRTLSHLSRDEVIGTSIFDYVSAESRAAMEECFARVVHTEKPDRYEIEYANPDGSTLSFEARVGPVKRAGRIAALTVSSTDITERKRAEDLLRSTSEQLALEREALERKNVALREILDQIDNEKKNLKHQVVTNVEQAIIPTLLRLKEMAQPSQVRNFQLLEKDLREITSPFIDTLKVKYTRLSPRELEVCRLIKNGLTSKEIADALNLSPMTVHKYRELIRKKFNLVHNGVNLNTFLQSL